MVTGTTSPGPLGHAPRRPAPPDVDVAAMAARHEAARAGNGRLAMRLAIAAEALFFAGLVASVWQIRRAATVWPPAGAPLPDTTLLAINTAVLVASAGTVWLGVRALAADRRRAGLGWLAATAVLGGGFLYGQWREFVHMGGWQVGGDLFAPLFNILSGFHGAHVVAGLVLLAITLARGLAGGLSAGSHLIARLSMWFWWLVAAVWLVLLAALLSF